jgi:hypothetical protein
MSTIPAARPRTEREKRANHPAAHVDEPLGRYTDRRGQGRELVRRRGAGGSTLVIDRLAGALTDERLVAHLAIDEPAQNAQIVASLYLADELGRYCRRLTPEDLTTDPFAAANAEPVSGPADRMKVCEARLLDRRGYLYRLQLPRRGTAVPELRWHRHRPPGVDGFQELVSVRQVIGSLENYEPARTLTAQALSAHDHDQAVSVAALRAELDRVNASPIVLNKGLREAVLAAVDERGLSMSEIAMRCGRVKRDNRGNLSGETSWLARRIGTLPEGGQDAPTPWVSSDVLALIAREGLGLAPREVEIG